MQFTGRIHIKMALFRNSKITETHLFDDFEDYKEF